MTFSATVDRFIDNFIDRADEIAGRYLEAGGHYIVDISPVVSGTLVGGFYAQINGKPNLPKLPPDPGRLHTKALISATAKQMR